MLPPPITNATELKKDTDHLRLLAVFHFIFAGLSVLGLGFMVFHYSIMQVIFSRPEIQNAQGGPPPEMIKKILLIFYSVMAVVLIIGGILNLLSALFLKSRKNRFYSLIIGGLNCVQVPIGTALGIFTIMVLTRDSVRRMYEEQTQG